MQELPLQPMPPARPVLGIPGDGMLDRGEVDADLMRPPGLEPRMDERVRRQILDHLEVGRRLPRSRPLHCPLCPLPAIPPEGRVNGPGPAPQPPLDQRRVLPHHLPRLHHPRQLPVRLLVPRHHHQPRGVLVEPVDDPRPPALPAARDSLAAGRRASPPCATGAEWTTSPGGLLDHGQVVVEVDDQAVRSPSVPSSARRRSAAGGRPTTIATSARLKVGHSGRSMKSVTAPSRTRSARFPSAPPIRSAAGTQTSQPLRDRGTRGRPGTRAAPRSSLR